MVKKWFIFRVVIIIRLVITIAIVAALGYVFYNIFNGYSDYRQTALKAIKTCIVVFLLIILFDCFCLYLLQRKYPDKELSVLNKILFVLSIIFVSIGTLLSAAVTIYGFSETVSDWEHNKDILTLLILLFCIIYSTSLIYSLINAIQLKRVISKNATVNSAALINEIGS